MYTLGPFTLTPGTAVGPLVIGRDVGAVQIHNDSPYKLYVAAQTQAPTATDSLQRQYLTLAGPWGHPVVRLQPRAGSRAEQAPNAISDFGGVLWLMPVDPQANLARAGTLSQLAEFHLDVYSPWEQAPEAWAMPRQFDLTSQPRVIALPPSVVPQMFNWSPVAGQTKTLGLYGLSSANLAARVANLHLYGGYIGTTVPAALGGIDLQLQAILTDGGAVQIPGTSTALLSEWQIWANSNASPPWHDYTPLVPSSTAAMDAIMNWAANVSPTPVNVALRLNCTAVSGTAPGLFVLVLAALDQFNTAYPYPIGSTNVYLSAGGGNGPF